MRVPAVCAAGGVWQPIRSCETLGRVHHFTRNWHSLVGFKHLAPPHNLLCSTCVQLFRASRREAAV